MTTNSEGRAHGEAWQFAEAVLSGKLLVLPRPSAVTSVTPDDGYVRVELKHCECCPKIFTREAGSQDRYCVRCRPRRPMLAAVAARPLGDRGRFGRERWRRALSGHRHGHS